jgi:hypothetical protein
MLPETKTQALLRVAPLAILIGVMGGLLFMAAHSPNSAGGTQPSYLDDIRLGMSYEQVEAVAGKPNQKQTFMSPSDGPSEDWCYGDTQVIFENGIVRVINRF